MVEFLQDYGVWVLFGALMILMFRMHGAQGGCGMGHRHQENDPQPEQVNVTPESDVSCGADAERMKRLERRRTGGCH